MRRLACYFVAVAALGHGIIVAVADFVIRSIAYPPSAGRHPLNTFALDTGEPCSDYEAPAQHFTHHERGRRHLAAARHT